MIKNDVNDRESAIPEVRELKGNQKWHLAYR